jgi:hypothetical protein
LRSRVDAYETGISWIVLVCMSRLGLTSVLPATLF